MRVFEQPDVTLVSGDKCENQSPNIGAIIIWSGVYLLETELYHLFVDL